MTKENNGTSKYNQKQAETKLCKNSCGFYGFANFEGYCSKCHAAHSQQKQNQATNVTVLKPPTVTNGLDLRKVKPNIVVKSNANLPENSQSQAVSHNAELHQKAKEAVSLLQSVKEQSNGPIPMELSEDDDDDIDDDDDTDDNELEQVYRQNNNSEETESLDRELDYIDEMAYEELLAATAAAGGPNSEDDEVVPIDIDSLNDELPIEELIRSISNDLANSKHSKMIHNTSATSTSSTTDKPSLEELIQVTSSSSTLASTTNEASASSSTSPSKTLKTTTPITSATAMANSKMLIARKKFESPQSPTASPNLAKSNKKAKLRCSICNRSIAVIGFTCRCGGQFCVVHRHTKDHLCNFDYRTQGAIDISKANPKIVGDKIKKI